MAEEYKMSKEVIKHIFALHLTQFMGDTHLFLWWFFIESRRELGVNWR